MIVVRVRPSVIAVACALQFGPEPCRLMGIQTRFPDVGYPTSEKVGFLRYPGEPILGDAEPVAPGPTSDHHVFPINHTWRYSNEFRDGHA